MGEVNSGSKRHRREFRWSKLVRDLVKTDAHASGSALRLLVTRLVEESGNPRDACWRFVRQLGVRGKCRRVWTEGERHRLLKLAAAHPVREVAQLMQRSDRSIRSMLHRLGVSAIVGQDWFTPYTLAIALHMNLEEIYRWIDRGWLKTRVLKVGKRKKVLIEADEFCRFCKTHRHEILGHRLNKDRLDFVFKFVLPPSHAELLPVRESKVERAAYDEQVRRQNDHSEADDDSTDSEDTEEQVGMGLSLPGPKTS